MLQKCNHAKLNKHREVDLSSECGSAVDRLEAEIEITHIFFVESRQRRKAAGFFEFRRSRWRAEREAYDRAEGGAEGAAELGVVIWFPGGHL